MSNFILSPLMNLPVPIVGVAPGPEWAQDINNSLTIVDSHDHSNGNGVQITPSGLNISSDLTMQGNDLTSIRTLALQVQAGTLADTTAIYSVNGNLYFNNSSGTPVQITNGGSVAGASGTITNLGLGGSSATFFIAQGAFVWQSEPFTPAAMDIGSIIVRKPVANSDGILILAPSSLLNANSTAFQLTLPTLPSTQSFMTLDASGQMAAPWTVDDSTIAIVSNQVVVKTNGVTNAKLAQMATRTVKANITGSTADPQDVDGQGLASLVVKPIIRVYNSPGGFTYVPSGADVDYLIVELVGGGGGGGGAGPGGGTGGTGQTTDFAGFANCTGGGGGTAGGFGVGGSPGVGSINVALLGYSSPGGYGSNGTVIQYVSPSSSSAGGGGGASFFGGGGRAGQHTAGRYAGISALAYGAGGGAGTSNQSSEGAGGGGGAGAYAKFRVIKSQINFTGMSLYVASGAGGGGGLAQGGAGGNGIIIITEYFI